MLIMLFFIISSFFQANELSKSIFKIYSHQNEKIINECTGFLIEEDLIITSASPLENAIKIEIEKIDDSLKYSAIVIKKSFDSNLALLKVNNKEFYRKTKKLELDYEILSRGDKLQISYFSFDDNSLKNLEGIIEKTWLAKQNYNWHDLLTYSIDSQETGRGLQGGVVIKSNKVKGICYFNFFTETSGITAIPSILIKRFIRSYKENKDDRIPYLGISLTNYENPYYNRVVDKPGNKITKFCYFSPIKNAKPLIIKEIEGYKVDKKGIIEIKKGLKIPFLYLPTVKLLGDKINIKFLTRNSLTSKAVVFDKNFTLDKTREDLYLVKEKIEKYSEKYEMGSFNFEVLNLGMFLKGESSYYYMKEKHPSLINISRNFNENKEVILLTNFSSGSIRSLNSTLYLEFYEQLEGFDNIKDLKAFFENKEPFISKTLRTKSGKILVLRKDD